MSPLDILLSKLPLLNVFSQKKIIRNKLLNRMGVQSWRVRLAEKRYQSRRASINENLKPYIERLNEEGIIIIEDFLPQEEFEELEKECLEATQKLPKNYTRKDGPNEYSNIAYKQLLQYPSIKKTMNNEIIEQLFNAAERRKSTTNKMVKLLEVLTQKERDGSEDPETKLHEDTFFNTHKAWLYISNVSEENAPFVYVRNSNNNLVTKREQYSYKYSLKKNNIKSRRISRSELRDLRLEEEEIVAKKNTFVMANTRGFHCRRMGKKIGAKRISLSFSVRYNPFI